jgi:hypothetical protein
MPVDFRLCEGISNMIRLLAASFLALAALGLFVGPTDAPAGHRHRRRCCQPTFCCPATANPKVCLEDLLYADPDNNYYFWDGDHYDDGTNCTGGPNVAYYETNAVDPYPQTCPNCDPADRRLRDQVPGGLKGGPIKANVHPIDTIPLSLQGHPNVNPRRGHFAAPEQWLIVDLGGGQEINVRLFNYIMDFKTAGFPNPPPQRSQHFGFESEGQPPNNATTIDVTQVRRYRGSKKAFMVTFNGDDYTVFTSTVVYP